MYIPSKTDLTSTLSAAEFNQFLTELQTNLISAAGMTPTSGTLSQVGTAVASIAAQGAVFGTDSGIANAYVITQVSPFPAPFQLKNGMTVKFRPGNDNTGACTVNAFGFGVKSIKQSDGTTPGQSAISTTFDTALRYDLTLDAWLIISNIAAATTTTAGASLLPSRITIANDVSDPNNDISFGAGNFQFSDGSGQAVATAMVKRLDANWAAGTNQGGLFSGVKAASTFYYLFAIYNPTTKAADFGFDISSIAANRPTGFTKYKCLGAILTDGVTNILPGKWYRDGSFYYTTRILEETHVNDSGSGNLILSGVPLINAKAIVQTQCDNNATGAFTNYNAGTSANNFIVRTSSQQSGSGQANGEIPVNSNATLYREWGGQSSRQVYLFVNGYIYLEA